MKVLFILSITFLSAVRATCPEGWDVAGTARDARCFRFQEIPLDWVKAREMCRTARGELVSFRNSEEKEWVQQKVDDLSTSKRIWHWWSGLNALQKANDWRWSDGTIIDGSLIHWQPGEPNQERPAERCGELHPTGFNDNDCSRAFPYICARDAGDVPSTQECPFGQVFKGKTCVTYKPTATVSQPATTTTTTMKPEVIPVPLQGACAVGWVESEVIKNKCYKFNPESRTWSQASQLCQNANGKLVEFETAAEKTWIRNQIRRLSEDSSTFFGLYKTVGKPSWWAGLTYSTEWKWASGLPHASNFIEWRPNEPNGRGIENCGELHADGFNDRNCEQEAPFICVRTQSAQFTFSMTSTIPTTSIPTPRQGECPLGWVESVAVPDRCYRFEEMAADWNHALKMCQSGHGTLASFQTKAEMEWIWNQVKRLAQTGKRQFWVGLNRLAADSQWRWTNNTPTTRQLLPWQPNEPNNAYEKCGEMHELGLNDNSCWRHYPYICARNKVLIGPASDCPFGEVLSGTGCQALTPNIGSRASRGACAEGWVELPVSPDRCFRFEEEMKSYDDAKKMCRSAHGDLVSIHTTGENVSLIAELEYQAKTTNKGSWWFGLNCQNDHSKWEWSDGTAVDSGMISWSSGVDATGEKPDHCATLTPDGATITSCWRTQPYICARPKVLDAGLRLCPWSEVWKGEGCETYYPTTYYGKGSYMYGEESERVADDLRRLKGKMEREVAVIKENFGWQVGNLTKRVQKLEEALSGTGKTPPRSNQAPAQADFDTALSIVIERLPVGTHEGSAMDTARRVLSRLDLDDIEITAAAELKNDANGLGRIKVQLRDSGTRAIVLRNKRLLRRSAIYRHVQIRAVRMNAG